MSGKKLKANKTAQTKLTKKETVKIVKITPINQKYVPHQNM